MLPPATGTTQDAMPRFDALDDPLVAAFRAEPDDVTRDHHVPLVGGERLEQPARRTLEDRALFVADDAMQPLSAEHASQSAILAVEIGSHRGAGVVLDYLPAGDRSFARDVAFAADALALRRVDHRRSIIHKPVDVL